MSEPRPVYPAGSAQEMGEFALLGQRLRSDFLHQASGPTGERSVVVIPSVSLDPAELQKISGASYFEERMLAFLYLLRDANTHLVYATSLPISDSVIDYNLGLLAGIPRAHARSRLTLVHCHDDSPIPLTQKLLARPDLLAVIQRSVAASESAYITCFNSTPLERTLSVTLGLPLYACDPGLSHLGTKSGSRKLFREAGVAMPDGVEDVRDEDDVVESLIELKKRDPGLRRAVVKLNESFAGGGNAIFTYPNGWTASSKLTAAAAADGTSFVDPNEVWGSYTDKLTRMGGIVECFIDAPESRSPSAQCEIDPTGQIQLVGTHDQILGGTSGQTYTGGTFPADEAYSREIGKAAFQVADVLASKSVIGQFSIDFVSKRVGSIWRHHALELNLRRGGTTAPLLLLELLSGAKYRAEHGGALTPTGWRCCYVASDRIQNDGYRQLSSDQIIDVAVNRGLHFDPLTMKGVAFYMLGATPTFGKLGMIAVGPDPDRARQRYSEALDALDSVVPDLTEGTPPPSLGSRVQR